MPAGARSPWGPPDGWGPGGQGAGPVVPTADGTGLPPAPPTAPGPPSPFGASAAGPGRSPRWGMGDVWIGFGLYLGAQVVTGLVLVLGLVVTGGLDQGVTQEQLNDDLGLWAVAVGVPIGWVALFGWPWVVSRRKGTGSLARDMGVAWQPIDLLVGLGGGVGALVVGAIAAVSFQGLFDREAPTNTDIIPSEGLGVATVLLLLVVIAIGTPIAEEVFFRGLVLGAARKRWGTPVGVVASSALFGLAHVQDTLEGWLYVGLVTGSYGVLFALLRVWSQGRLAAPIVAHMVVNGTGVLLVVVLGQ